MTDIDAPNIPTPTPGSLGIAARCWCTEYTGDIEMDVRLAKAFAAKLDEFVDALIWCSGSGDFAPGGMAREGWLKVCEPLLKEHRDHPDYFPG